MCTQEPRVCDLRLRSGTGGLVTHIPELVSKYHWLSCAPEFGPEIVKPISLL